MIEDGKKINLEIWGRNFDVEVSYDLRDDEDVSSNQIAALNKFLENSNKIFPVAEEKAKDYCIEENGDEVEEDSVSNIFKYVIPKTIFVSRTDDKRMVSLLCHYKLNLDDGMAIVFENEEFAEIGPEYIVL